MSIDTGAHEPNTHNHTFCAQVHTAEEEERKEEEQRDPESLRVFSEYNTNY